MELGQERDQRKMARKETGELNGELKGSLPPKTAGRRDQAALDGVNRAITAAAAGHGLQIVVKSTGKSTCLEKKILMLSS